ncbi:MAG TPA: hypothetical protein VMY87_07490 [Armatimonadota bacterium]|nr:hypothetical protein [Armatimonadota bacterium]
MRVPQRPGPHAPGRPGRLLEEGGAEVAAAGGAEAAAAEDAGAGAELVRQEAHDWVERPGGRRLRGRGCTGIIADLGDL